ncbi:hypothetical protein HDV01_002125 [Terramyces sp. JEL0728]|nr:hypothetical protein HDV01_002125 [Terramyces sp. JEL0728]
MTVPLIFQSGWLNSYNCDGPPSSMYIFNEDNPTPVFVYVESDTPLPLCGTANLPVPIGCCVSSVNLQFTMNYPSMTRNYIDDINDYTPPLSAQNVQYCRITGNDEQSLLGYNQTFFIGGGMCVDGIAKCDLLTNEITLFNDTDCTGYSESYSLGDNNGYNSLILGNISTGAITMAGKVKFIWEAASPFSETVPLFKMPLEKFSVFCYGLSFLIPTVTSGFYYYRYRNTNKKKDLFFSVAQFMLLVNIISQFVYTMTVFPDANSTMTYDFFSQLTNISSLFTVYISLYSLFTIYSQYQQSILEKLTYAVLTVLHFLTMYWYAVSDVYGLVKGADDWYYYFCNLQPRAYFIWRTIYILVEMLPSIIILRKVFSSIHQKKVNTQKANIYFMGVLLIFQICTVVVYEILNVVVNYTLLIGSDRAYSAMYAIFYALQALNSLFVLVIYSLLVKMTATITGKKLIANTSDTVKIYSKFNLIRMFNRS